MLHRVCHEVLVGIPSTEFIGQDVQMMVQVYMISKDTQMTSLTQLIHFIREFESMLIVIPEVI